MRAGASGWMEAAVGRAKERASDLEPWPDYFVFKAEELRTILKFYDFSSARSIIEIGCGNGFTSYLLSKTAGRVTALDLPARNSLSHSVGIQAAQELAGRMGAGNLSIAAGSVAGLGYGDGSFDLVFSQYVLHYVEDKRKALSEMRRVMADDGAMVCIVPNFIERVFVPIVKAEYVVSRIFERLLSKAAPEGPAQAAGVAARKHDAPERANVSRAFDDYLLLRADGAYRSYFEELLSHRPCAWRRLFEDNGFKVVKTFSTQMLPLGLFSFLGQSGTRLISGGLHSLTRAIGGLPIMRSIGYSLGIVAVKKP